MKKYFLFDCEMGGVNPKSSLLTLYGMVLDHQLNIEDEIHLKIKPDDGVYKLTAKALEVNNIDIVEHDKKAIFESSAAVEFYDFAYKHAINSKMIPAGHNLSLDIRFVQKHLLRANNQDGNDWGKFFSHRRLDTATLAHGLVLSGKLPQELDCSLGSLAKYFNIDYTKSHNEKLDAQLSLKILKLLLDLM